MIKRTTLFLAFLLCTPGILFSQSYSVEHSVHTYEPLTNANLLDESNPDIDPSGADRYQAIPIGFTFNYHNYNFDSIKVGENGYVIFEQNGVFESFINIFECQQKNFQNDSALSPIYYEVSGDPGNQIFKLEFVKSGFVSDSEDNDYINYQLWIHEYCNVFEFHFGDISIDSLEFDLFYNGSPAPFMGYGNNNPFIFYVLDGSLAQPGLSSNAANSLDSVPNPNSVYTFRDCFLDIDEEETNSFSIYPNPTSDIINITFIESIEESILSISNLNGQTVFTDIVPPNNFHSLNIDFLTAGMYVLNIKSATTIYSSMLLKQ